MTKAMLKSSNLFLCDKNKPLYLHLPRKKGGFDENNIMIEQYYYFVTHIYTVCSMWNFREDCGHQDKDKILSLTL